MIYLTRHTNGTLQYAKRVDLKGRSWVLEWTDNRNHAAPLEDGRGFTALNYLTGQATSANGEGGRKPSKSRKLGAGEGCCMVAFPCCGMTGGSCRFHADHGTVSGWRGSGHRGGGCRGGRRQFRNWKRS